MIKLVLIRHGESEWNKLNLFTGWTDVEISEKGVEEAKNGGKLLHEEGYSLQRGTSAFLYRFSAVLTEPCIRFVLLAAMRTSLGELASAVVAEEGIFIVFVST